MRVVPLVTFTHLAAVIDSRGWFGALSNSFNCYPAELKKAKKNNLTTSPRTYVDMAKIVLSEVNFDSLRARQFGSHKLTIKRCVTYRIFFD